MFRPMRLYEGGRVSKVKLRKPRDDRATPSLPITIFHWRTVRTLGCPRCSLPRRVFFREIDFRKKILYYRYHRRIIIHNCIVFIFYSFFGFCFCFFFFGFLFSFELISDELLTITYGAVELINYRNEREN